MPTSCLDPGPVKTRQKRLLEDRQCPQHMVKRLADIAAPARRADQLLRIEHVDPRVLRQPQEQSPSRAEDVCTKGCSQPRKHRAQSGAFVFGPSLGPDCSARLVARDTPAALQQQVGEEHELVAVTHRNVDLPPVELDGHGPAQPDRATMHHAASRARYRHHSRQFWMRTVTHSKRTRRCLPSAPHKGPNVSTTILSYTTNRYLTTSCRRRRC